MLNLQLRGAWKGLWLAQLAQVIACDAALLVMDLGEGDEAYIRLGISPYLLLYLMIQTLREIRAWGIFCLQALSQHQKEFGGREINEC